MCSLLFQGRVRGVAGADDDNDNHDDDNNDKETGVYGDDGTVAARTMSHRCSPTKQRQTGRGGKRDVDNRGRGRGEGDEAGDNKGLSRFSYPLLFCRIRSLRACIRNTCYNYVECLRMYIHVRKFHKRGIYLKLRDCSRDGHRRSADLFNLTTLKLEGEEATVGIFMTTKSKVLTRRDKDLIRSTRQNRIMYLIIAVDLQRHKFRDKNSYYK